jgi:hypothetical protein
VRPSSPATGWIVVARTEAADKPPRASPYGKRGKQHSPQPGTNHAPSRAPRRVGDRFPPSPRRRSLPSRAGVFARENRGRTGRRRNHDRTPDPRRLGFARGLREEKWPRRSSPPRWSDRDSNHQYGFPHHAACATLQELIVQNPGSALSRRRRLEDRGDYPVSERELHPPPRRPRRSGSNIIVDGRSPHDRHVRLRSRRGQRFSPSIPPTQYPDTRSVLWPRSSLRSAPSQTDRSNVQSATLGVAHVDRESEIVDCISRLHGASLLFLSTTAPTRAMCRERPLRGFL